MTCFCWPPSQTAIAHLIRPLIANRDNEAVITLVVS